jgi:hypothetical protein
MAALAMLAPRRRKVKSNEYSNIRFKAGNLTRTFSPLKLLEFSTLLAQLIFLPPPKFFYDYNEYLDDFH